MKRDPHLLCVDPDRFADQMKYLRRQADVIPLRATTTRDRSSGLRVAITFDDGYADNAHVAKPILEHLGMPATFFITAGVVEAGGEFWWDRLENLLLSSSLGRGQLDIELGNRALSIDLSTETAREQAHAALHARLRRLPPRTIERVLDDLTSDLGAGTNAGTNQGEQHPLLTEQELSSLSSELFEVGAHTISHPLLSAQSQEEQRREIDGGRKMLEGLVREQVDLFSYPFGGLDAFSKETVRLVDECGYAFACTGLSGRVSSRTDPLRVPRHFVHDWDQTEFGDRLSRWSENK